MQWMRSLLLLVAGLSLILLTACPDPQSAPYGSNIGELEDATVAWNPEYEGDPNYYAILRADFTVVGPDSEPMNNAVIEIISGYAGVYIIPMGVINIEECPTPEANPESQWLDYCADSNQTWADLTGEFDNDLQPTYYRGYTNSYGVESVWFWIEDMPIVYGDPDEETGEILAEGVSPVDIWATIGVDSEAFTITVSES